MVHGRILLAAIAAALVVFGHSVADARVWRVERDGSGDFSTIQSAVDASATGDTIMIGPGRYDDHHIIQQGVDIWDVVVEVGSAVNALTLLGSDIDSTIIGPSWPTEFANPGIGLAAPDVDSLVVRRVRFENLSHIGLCVNHAHVDVQDCSFYFPFEQAPGACYAIWGGFEHGADIRDCSFELVYRGVFCVRYSRDVWVRNCDFLNCHGTAVYAFGDVGDIHVLDSDFRGTLPFANVGVAAYYLGLVEVRRCSFDHLTNKCIFLKGVTNTECYDNVMVFSWPSATGLYFNLWEGNTFEGSGNVIDAGSGFGIFIYSRGLTLDFHGNQVLRAGNAYYVYAPYDDGITPFHVPMGDNFWGTTDTNIIDQWIYDGNDMAEGGIVIDYLPLGEELTGIADTTISSPDRRLYASPNPFNPQTTVKYTLVRPDLITLRAFDLRGRLVRSLLPSAQQGAGPHELTWDGLDDSGTALPSGAYLLRLEAGAEARSLRVVLIR